MTKSDPPKEDHCNQRCSHQTASIERATNAPSSLVRATNAQDEENSSKTNTLVASEVSTNKEDTKMTVPTQNVLTTVVIDPSTTMPPPNLDTASIKKI